MTPSPVPEAVADELTRLVRRWQQLPLDQAQFGMPRVRLTIERLAGESVPDLGPAVVMDQLTVVAYDRCVVGDQALVQTEFAALRQAI